MKLGKRPKRQFLLSVNLFWGLLVLLMLSCKSVSEENKSQLIQYPVPFYQRNKDCTPNFFYGIQTKRFKLVKNTKGVWLLYDKLIDPDQVNNLAGLDEYIFIQLELEQKLNQLIQKKDSLWFLQNYDFYAQK